MWVKYTKGVQLLVKNLYVIFWRDHRQLQRLNLAGSGWKAALSTPDLVHSQWSPVSEGSCTKTQIPMASQAFHMFTFPALRVTSSLDLFIWGLGQRASSGASSDTPLWSIGGGNLEDIFPHSDSVPNAFPLFPLPLLHSRVHKPKRVFCSELSQQWDDLHICADPLNTQMVHHSMGENGTEGVGTFLSFQLLLILSQ